MTQDSGEEDPSRGADMYHCNGAGKLGLIIPPPSPSSYRRRGGAELRQRTHCTHAPSLRGHKNWGSRAMGDDSALATLYNVQLYFSHQLGGLSKVLFSLRRAPGHWPDTVDCITVAAPHLGDPSGAGRGGCAAAVISARHGAAKWEDGPGECWHLPPTPPTPDADAAFSLVLSHVHHVQPF